MPNPSQLATLHTRIAPAAVASEKDTGIPAEMTTAQCILESGWLANAPFNNCFGIKEYQGCKGRQLLVTKEWFDSPSKVADFLAKKEGRTAVPARPSQFNGRQMLYVVKDWFATFDSLADCFTYHGNLLLNGAPYKAATQQYKQDHNLVNLIRSISSYYATDPTYALRVEELATEKYVQQAIEAIRYATNGY